MRDRGRRREPNLDPNSCTEADFAYFVRFEYPKLVLNKNKANTTLVELPQKESGIEIK